MAEPHWHGVPGVVCYEKHETETQYNDRWAEALDILTHIVSQATVNPVIASDKHGEYVARYDMPVGSIHKAIPFLQRFGIVVDVYGAVHRSSPCGTARESVGANDA